MSDSQSLRHAHIFRGLSARILALTVIALLIGEVLIFVPSIARHRLTYLQERAAEAYLATLIPSTRGESLSPALEQALLSNTQAKAIVVMSEAPELMLGRMVKYEASFRLHEDNFIDLIVDAIKVLLQDDNRTISIIAKPRMAPETMVEVILDEWPLHEAMLDYAVRILILSLVLSVIVGGLMFLALQRLIVRPLTQVTDQLANFRASPEDESHLPPASRRSDEIGVVKREMARMQHDLRLALAQKTRLAGLGEAVGKINHDLRNVLATAILISDRLEMSDDPQVKQAAPRLTETLERALSLCAATLDFARSRPRPLCLQATRIAALIEGVCEDLELGRSGVDVRNSLPPEHTLRVDPDEIYRALLNLARNAAEAMDNRGRLGFAHDIDRSRQSYAIRITDTGPGLPPETIDRLFEPFAYSSRAGGSGLGLAIAREIMRRHGGDLTLGATGPRGTQFVATLPLQALQGHQK